MNQSMRSGRRIRVNDMKREGLSSSTQKEKLATKEKVRLTFKGVDGITLDLVVRGGGGGRGGW